MAWADIVVVRGGRPAKESLRGRVCVCVPPCLVSVDTMCTVVLFVAYPIACMHTSNLCRPFTHHTSQAGDGLYGPPSSDIEVASDAAASEYISGSIRHGATVGVVAVAAVAAAGRWLLD